ncbi:ATP-dependent zinc protease family protein [Blastomonas aquatica]|uniref:Ribosomal protein S6 modification protein n=1 Tax=Blastomonas aquatica TaxID=1510276 RepID=A0ABQ1JQ04_9SPHN|nr:RimK/LysX family protein [Blastomonas aquatica]GGB73473.1 ribosomal protein S6 modification protein [Blastomonas aquatica]
MPRSPLRTKVGRELVDIGWSECIDLPDLGLHRIKAKIDTGAATSSIHATRVKPLMIDGQLVVEFWFRAHRGEPARKYRAPGVEQRSIKSSNGAIELRYVIETTMILGSVRWKGHMTLANRTTMTFPILIGRRALRRGFRVDCARKWVLGQPEMTDR